MDDFITDGFLGLHESQLLGRIKTICPEELGVCLELNKISQEILYQLKIDNNNSVELVSSMLYIRLLATFQGAMAISFRGMESLMETMIRCCLEPMFPLIAISRNADFVEKYIDSDESRRIDALRSYNEYCKLSGNRDKMVEESAIMGKYVVKPKKISVKECARNADLLEWYYTVYCNTSSALHASIHSFNSSCEIDAKSRRVIAIKNEPTLDGHKEFYTCIAAILEMSTNAICEIFQLKFPKRTSTEAME